MAETTNTGKNWGDLAPRVISGLVLAGVGLAAIWWGGWPFAALVVLAVGVIVWEISRMCLPARAGVWAPLGLLAGAGLLVALWASVGWLALLLWLAVLVVAAGLAGAGGDRARLVLYLAYVLVAGWGLVQLRADGFWPVVWLVSVVVATDIAGYFAGRILGGPKFWPKVSPKKTWSGTIAGWIAAGLVGLGFIGLLGPGIVWLSVIVSFASQMGDAAESALKRAKGVKDASAIIPGHGGVFDRFDALLAASFVLTLARFTGLGG